MTEIVYLAIVAATLGVLVVIAVVSLRQTRRELDRARRQQQRILAQAACYEPVATGIAVLDKDPSRLCATHGRLRVVDLDHCSGAWDNPRPCEFPSVE